MGFIHNRNSLSLLVVLNCLTVHGQTWESVPGELLPGPGGLVGALHVFDNKLYAGGWFNTAGGIDVKHIAAWDGASWSRLGGPFQYGITMPSWVKVIMDYNSFIYVGGNFFEAANLPNSEYLAKYGSGVWSNASLALLGAGTLETMQVYQGELYIGGNIRVETASDTAVSIARWNGSQWNPVGAGDADGTIDAMAVYNGELYAGGLGISNIGGTDVVNIGRWDGSQWKQVGVGLDGWVGTMSLDTIHNELYVGGAFLNAYNLDTSSIYVRGVARWNGVGWADVSGGTITGGVRAMAFYHNKLYVGGSSPNALEADTVLASWDGRTWEKVGGINNTLEALAVFKDTLYVGGYFTTVNGDSMNYIARYAAPDIPTCLNYTTAIGADADTVYLTQGASVQFYDSSDVALDSWYWNFGDGDTGTVQNPVHAYGATGVYTVMLANVCGYYADTAYKTIVVEQGIGTEEITTAGFNIYPNPAKNKLTVQAALRQNGILKFYTVQGTSIAKYPVRQGKNTLEVDTRGWAKGVYLCKLEIGGKELQSKRVVVE